MSRIDPRSSGFTLVEMLMVMILVSILAAVAFPQFINFTTDAKNASAQAGLGAIRSGIETQKGQAIIRCGATAGFIPTYAQMAANNILVGGPCTPVQIPNPINWQFVLGRLPDNPWSGDSVSDAGKRAVTQCALNGCLRDGTVSCDGATAYGPTIGGWCYNPTNGAVWANSNNNGSAAPNGEYSF